MQHVRILLLNAHPERDLSDALGRLLTAGPRAKVRLRQSRLDLSHTPPDLRAVTGGCAGTRPDVIVLVPPAEASRLIGPTLLSLQQAAADVPIIVAVEVTDPEEIFSLLRLGVADFITPPLRAAEILPRVWRLLDHRRQEDAHTQTLKEKLGLKQLIGVSPAFQAEIKKLLLLAKCDMSVMISGETGTGKELCARAIHYLGPRAHKPFVPINCGAIPPELMENELFGHERGAFTGATMTGYGMIHEAEGGTLFLDEVDCLSLLAQVKLLRFLQEKEYRPLGSTKARGANVRVIAATNSDLEQAVREGRLRQDLYYRLDIMTLHLPPVRERPEDVPLLARHFLARFAAEFDKPAVDLTPEAVRKLAAYGWPGNVRELEHTIARAVSLSEGTFITDADICLPAAEPDAADDSFRQAKAKIVAQFEKSYIQRLLLSHQGNVSKAAQAARKNRRAFWQLIRKHHIDVHGFRVTH